MIDHKFIWIILTKSFLMKKDTSKFYPLKERVQTFAKKFIKR